MTRTPKTRTARDFEVQIGESAKREASNLAPEASAPVPPLPRQTKAALLRQMILDQNGASLQALIEATGWQAHTVRAALSGLRKSGLTITHESHEEGPRYRGVEASPATPIAEVAAKTRSPRRGRKHGSKPADAAGEAGAADASSEVRS